MRRKCTYIRTYMLMLCKCKYIRSYMYSCSDTCIHGLIHVFMLWCMYSWSDTCIHGLQMHDAFVEDICRRCSDLKRRAASAARPAAYLNLRKCVYIIYVFVCVCIGSLCVCVMYMCVYGGLEEARSFSGLWCISKCVSASLYIYIYIYTHTHTCTVFVYVYVGVHVCVCRWLLVVYVYECVCTCM